MNAPLSAACYPGGTTTKARRLPPFRTDSGRILRDLAGTRLMHRLGMMLFLTCCASTSQAADSRMLPQLLIPGEWSAQVFDYFRKSHTRVLVPGLPAMTEGKTVAQEDEGDGKVATETSIATASATAPTAATAKFHGSTDYASKSSERSGKELLKNEAPSNQTFYADLEHWDIDMPATQTPDGVAEAVRVRMAFLSFQQLFSCSGSECGPALDWQLSFSLLNTGPDETQRYQLYAIPSKEGEARELAQVYINQTGCCPRVSLRRLRQGEGAGQAVLTQHKLDARRAGKLISKWRDRTSVLAPHESLQLPIAWFGSGQDHLDQELTMRIGELALVLKQLPPLSLTLIGYTDPTGDPARNADLRIRRTETVQRALLEHGLTASVSDDIINRREQSAERSEYGVDCQTLACQRRVDIVLRNPQSTEDEFAGL